MSYVHGGGTSLTPSQLRRNLQQQQHYDTPTPAPSSGHNSTFISSLKPIQPASSSLSYDYGTAPRGAKGILRPNPLPYSKQQHARVPLGNRNGPKYDLETADLDLSKLDIQSDGTSRIRKGIEGDIQRHFDDLQASDVDSIGLGDLSDLDNEGGMGRNLRREMEDESSLNSSGSESLGDDFSVEIGMAGVRSRPPAPPGGPTNGERFGRRPEVEDDMVDDTMSFMTISRTVSPASPRRPVPTTSAPAPLPHANPRQIFNHFDNIPSSKSDAYPTVPKPTTTKPRKVDPTPFVSQPRNAYDQPFPRVPNNSRESKYDEKSDGRTRLPDITGLTEGLQSPEKVRGHYPVRKASENVEDAKAMADALDQLRPILAKLKREKSIAQSRVEDLENQVHNDSVRYDRATQSAEGGQRDSSRLLREEQEKRKTVEAQVTHLRDQVTHLTHQFNTQSAALQSLQQSHQRHSSRPSDLNLRDEVLSLRNGLNGLGVEVEEIKSTLNLIARESEQEEEDARWRREEQERKSAVDRERKRMNEMRNTREGAPEPLSEDPDVTPKASKRMYHYSGPETPQTGRSFLDDAAIQQMRDDLARAETRSVTPQPRRPTVKIVEEAPTAPACTRRHYDSPLPRPHTAPIPSKSSRAPPNLYSYASDPYQKSHDQLIRERYAAAPAQNSSQPPDDLRAEFRRADQIFESVQQNDPSSTQHGGICSICRAKFQGGERNVGANQAEGERKTGGHVKDLMRILRNLEGEFEHQRMLFIELSDTYKRMDAKAGGNKRMMLANHLKETIDVLEQKAAQVKGLHDLVHSSTESPRYQPHSAPEFGAGRMREGVV